jgi:hypothetical protein
MKLRTAQLSLVVSTVALGAVVIAFAASGSSQPQVKLPGPSVRIAEEPPTPSTARTTPAKLTATVSGSASGTPTTLPLKQAPAARPFPRRIIIPSLSLDADVVASGLKPDGSMDVPSTAAGWYHYGANPSDPIGSAVIAGHIDREKSPGVFFDLPRLEIGETVWVTDAAGDTNGFVVSERYQVAKDQLPGTELFRVDGDPTLTLITCGGRFDSERRHYDDNIVIRAVPISSPS